MKENKKGEFRSRVYTERPEYADLPSAEKFQAIQGIIITRLKQHPKAICSYSGGSDSDIMLDMIERARHLFGKDYLPPIKYVFFNTGLEMDATKRHVKEVAEKYGVEIEAIRREYEEKLKTAQEQSGEPDKEKQEFKILLVMAHDAVKRLVSFANSHDKRIYIDKAGELLASSAAALKED